MRLRLWHSPPAARRPGRRSRSRGAPVTRARAFLDPLPDHGPIPASDTTAALRGSRRAPRRVLATPRRCSSSYRAGNASGPVQLGKSTAGCCVPPDAWRHLALPRRGVARAAPARRPAMRERRRGRSCPRRSRGDPAICRLLDRRSPRGCRDVMAVSYTVGLARERSIAPAGLAIRLSARARPEAAYPWTLTPDILESSVGLDSQLHEGTRPPSRPGPAHGEAADLVAGTPCGRRRRVSGAPWSEADPGWRGERGPVRPRRMLLPRRSLDGRRRVAAVIARSPRPTSSSEARRSEHFRATRDVLQGRRSSRLDPSRPARALVTRRAPSREGPSFGCGPDEYGISP